MFDKLTKMLEQGYYRDVLKEMEKYDISEYTEELIIIAVSALMALGEYEAARQYLQTGLRINPKNAEMYLLLGNYYERYNRAQAYLCYENAELYCEGPQDETIIHSFKEKLEEERNFNYRKVSIVILSYNTYEMTRCCIESIRRNNVSSSYEIIVVDNASTDRSLEWLEQQEDVVLIKNSENRGFPYGCNQGIEAADSETDIMLLNNDTILFPNSLFWLRMGLYEEDNIGATGCMTNYASNGQAISEKYATIQEYEEYAIKNNVLQDNPHELKIYLVGFAVLIRREALDEIGRLDIRYSPGQFEDCDLGVNLCQNGWHNVLCHNSFIYHFGGGAGQNRQAWQDIYQRNREIFKNKWAFDIVDYSHVNNGIINMLDCAESKAIHVLDIGCGLGSTLARLKFRYPNAHVYGIENKLQLVAVGGRFLNIVQSNIEKMELPFDDVQFDYIILANVLEYLQDPEGAVRKLAKRLKEGGAFLCSIPNLMNLSVIYSLLQGKFEYKETGVGTQLRFFTLDSINKLFERCNFQIEKLQYLGSKAEWNEKEMKCLESLLNIPGCADRDQFLANQYLFRARRYIR